MFKLYIFAFHYGNTARATSTNYNTVLCFAGKLNLAVISTTLWRKNITERTNNRLRPNPNTV